MKYFIAYSHPNGMGNCQITTEIPINTMDRVKEVEDTILKSDDLTDLCITNWILLEK